MAQSKFVIQELRYWIYIVTLTLFFIIWFLQLFRLQILEGEVYASEASKIIERRKRLSAKRGLIYYRDGQIPIVNNIDVFTVYLIPDYVPKGKLNNVLALLSKILEVDKARLEEKVAKAEQLLQPVELKRNVDINTIQKIAERQDRLIGVSYESSPERNLIDRDSIIHIVGYVGNISDDELEVLYNEQYQKNSSIGKTGIEQYYDSILRGYDGSRVQTVDAKGNILEEYIESPTTGSSLILSIDRRIQRLAQEALGNRVGSAIVLRPATGEILAMVSAPWYKISDFGNNRSFQELIDDPRKPLINRVIQSQYAPASTFKLIVGTAMLAERSFSPAEYIFDPGYWKLGNRLFRCWLRTGHGEVNFIDAIAHSCNIYLGIVSVQYVGQENILKYASKYGLGQLTGIDLPNEIDGFLPSPDWKYRTYNQPWTQGDTLNISIGQGFLLTTPLQVAVYTAAIVNNGIAYKPFLLHKVREQYDNGGSYDNNDDQDDITERKILYDMKLSPSVFQQVRYAMRQAVVRGTARTTIYNGVVNIAAKTGTAEIGISNNWHSWFASYGPYIVSDPEKRVVVVTQVEADPTQEKELYDWWAPRAADIIYRGIFANETYEEVWLDYKKRKVWFHPMMKVPEQYKTEPSS